MVDTRDILLKAAEDVTQGMWCKGEWFMGARGDWSPENEANPYLVHQALEVDQMLSSHRCAEGSLVLATRLLGGDETDYETAEWEVVSHARLVGVIGSNGMLFDYNDNLPDDPFEAGQQLAELFRQTAESL